MPKAIMVKYHPETSTKPAKYSAEDDDGNRVYVSAHVDHSEHGGVAVVAAKKLCEKMNWKGKLIHGGFKDREYFIFERYENTIIAPRDPAGMQDSANSCPKCGGHSFQLQVTFDGTIDIEYNDGDDEFEVTDSEPTDSEWDGPARCLDCDWAGELADLIALEEGQVICRTCAAIYADGGDGFDGECPSCADKREKKRGKK